MQKTLVLKPRLVKSWTSTQTQVVEIGKIQQKSDQ